MIIEAYDLALDAVYLVRRDFVGEHSADLVFVQIAQCAERDSIESFEIQSCHCNGSVSPCGISSAGR